MKMYFKICFCVVFLYSFISLALHQENDGTDIKFLQHNLGTYADYISNRLPRGTNPTAKVETDLYNERDNLLKEYFKKVIHRAPDIIAFQEAYGLRPSIEENRIKAMLKEHFSSYGTATNEQSDSENPGEAVLFYRMNRFKLIKDISSRKQARVVLYDKKLKRHVIAVSAYLDGFDISKPENIRENSIGAEQIVDIIKMEDNYKDALIVVGVDLNAPPTGTKLLKVNDNNVDVKFSVSSIRTKVLSDNHFLTASSLDPLIPASPTAQNPVTKDGIAKLDYVWAWSTSENISIEEQVGIDSNLVNYELGPAFVGQEEAVQYDKLPFSDHLPVFSVIKATPMPKKCSIM